MENEPSPYRPKLPNGSANKPGSSVTISRPLPPSARRFLHRREVLAGVLTLLGAYGCLCGRIGGGIVLIVLGDMIADHVASRLERRPGVLWPLVRITGVVRLI